MNFVLLFHRRSGRLPRALVLAPTRELAKQVEKEIKESALHLNIVCVYGHAFFCNHAWLAEKLAQKHLDNPLTINLVGELDEKLAEGIKLYALSPNVTPKWTILSDLIMALELQLILLLVRELNL